MAVNLRRIYDSHFFIDQIWSEFIFESYLFIMRYLSRKVLNLLLYRLFNDIFLQFQSCFISKYVVAWFIYDWSERIHTKTLCAAMLAALYFLINQSCIALFCCQARFFAIIYLIFVPYSYTYNMLTEKHLWSFFLDRYILSG